MSEGDVFGAAGDVRHRSRQEYEDALHLGPRKKPYLYFYARESADVDFSLISCLSDPLIHHGRHFGRTVHALCNVRTLLKNGTRGLLGVHGSTNEVHRYFNFQLTFILCRLKFPSWRDTKEGRAFQELLRIIPGLEARLRGSSNEEVLLIADLVCRVRVQRWVVMHQTLPDSERGFWGSI